MGGLVPPEARTAFARGPHSVTRQDRDTQMRRCFRSPALLVLVLLAGCAMPNVSTNVDATGMPNPEIALRDSFQHVDAEMMELGDMGPGTVERNSATVVPAELQKVVAFAWQGPLDGAVRKLAASVGYSVMVSAPPNGLPLAVGISTGAEQVFKIFHALGEAAGTNATVQLDPLHHRVEVIHHA
jgi:defect in organelle trafficking protein DotD